MSDSKALLIGILGSLTVFLVVEGRRIFNFFSIIKNKDENMRINKRLNTIMKEENVSFEDAKQKLFLDEIVKALEIDVSHWVVNRNLTLIKGDRVSFEDKEVGLVQGIFLGIKKPDIVGYDDIYVVRDTRKSIIRQASISYVKEETINVYR